MFLLKCVNTPNLVKFTSEHNADGALWQLGPEVSLVLQMFFPR